MADITITTDQDVRVLYFDTESGNPRMTQMGIIPPHDIPQIAYVLDCKERSHGEVLTVELFRLLENFENTIILIDEPESGLSIKNQFRLIRAIKNSPNKNNQLFISTHCFPLIANEKEVFSVEHGVWMSSIEFVKKQKSKKC